MRITRYLAAALLAAVCAAAWAAPEGVSALFAGAPESVVPFIDPSKRLDMLDYYGIGSATPINNSLNSPARIVSIGKSQLTFSMGNDSVLTSIAMLPAGKDTLVMVVNTVPMPWPDSRVDFYTTDWKPLDGGKLWRSPVLRDWLRPQARCADSLSSVQEVVPFIITEIVYNDSTGTLEVVNNTRRFFAQGDRPAAVEMLLPRLEYRWNGAKFIAVEP